MARAQASSGECEVVGSLWHQKNQQLACLFRSLCDTSYRTQSIDEFGTWQYTKQRGQLNITQHKMVLTALEQQVQGFQDSLSCEKLEDKQLLDEAINEMGTIVAPPVEDKGEQHQTAEQEVVK